MAPAEAAPVNATTYLLSVDQGSDDPPSDSTKDDATTTPQRHHGKLSIMFHTLWGCCIIFGVYAFLFYAKTAIFHAFPAWEMTFPGLYQDLCPASNWLIVVHIFLGSFLMIVSPTQYLKWIRRSHIDIHRWIGRITLIAASICATCAMIKIFLVGSAQGGYHASVGNTLLGLAVLVCAVFTYYYVAISKNIELHALLLFVEIYWRFYRNKGYNSDETLFADTTKPAAKFESCWQWTLTWLAAVVFVGSTFLFLLGVWGPALLADLSEYSVE